MYLYRAKCVQKDRFVPVVCNLPHRGHTVYCFKPQPPNINSFGGSRLSDYAPPPQSLPNAKGDLQQGADSRNIEDGADEVALCEAVMLQTQALGQDQWDGNDATKCS